MNDYFIIPAEQSAEVIRWLKANFGPSYNSNITHNRATFRNSRKTCRWWVSVNALYELVIYFYYKEDKILFWLTWSGTNILKQDWSK